MKKYKFLLMICLLAVTNSLWAQKNYAFACKTGGTSLFYQYNDSKSVNVTYPYRNGHNCYYGDYEKTKPTGNLIIPSSVTYNGKIFSVTSIGDSAFYNCRELTSFNIPNSVTSIGYCVFGSTSWWNNQPNGIVYKDGWCLGWKDNSEKSKPLNIQDGTRGIANNTFRAFSSKSCTIPSSVKWIGDAFYNCALDTVNYNAENCVSMGHQYAYYATYTPPLYAFNDCNIYHINIGHNVKTIPDYAFYNCSSISTINCEAIVPPDISNITFSSSTYTTANLIVPRISVQAYKNHPIWGRFNIIEDFWYEEQPNGLLYKDGWCIGYKGAKPIGTITIKGGTIGIKEGAFANCTGITGINLPASVVEIEENTFYNTGWWQNQENGIVYLGNWCLGYKSTTTPPTVSTLNIKEGTQRIANTAFSACEKLTTVNFPSSLIAVGKDAFLGCSKITKVNISGTMANWCNVAFGNATANPLYYAKHLYINNAEVTSVVIPTGITAINAYTFYNGIAITSIVMPQNVSSIGQYAFYGCAALGNISLPSISTIEPYTFGGCKSLTSLSIPESVTKIGAGAFMGCSGISSFSLPSKITVVEDYTFADCSKMLSVQLTDIITSIGKAAFKGCSKLASITIPNTTTFVGDSAFCNCSQLSQVTLSSALTSIQPYTFYHCSSLSSISIPSQVKTIGEYAFYHCNSLSKLSIPNAVTTIGKYAFAECSGMNQLTLGSAVADIADYAFYNCSNITLVAIPAATQSIGMRGFANCTRLMSVSFANAGTQIGTEAFYNTGWYNLQADGLIYLNNRCLGYKGDKPVGVLTIKDGTIGIASKAFADCSDITSLNLPESLVTIADSAFANCRWLAIQALPSNITNIGNYAFYGCKNIYYLPIPNSVTHIGKYAFAECSGIYDIPLGNGITVLEPGVFKGCTSLYSVTIPNTITEIRERAFYGCTGLTSATIANSVTLIKDDAFYGDTSLTSISIPSSVETIGERVFYNCTHLSSIAIGSGVKSIGEETFTNTGWYTAQANGILYLDNWCLGYKGDKPTGVLSIQDNTKGLANSAFKYCRELTSFSMPTSVLYIGEKAFYNCDQITVALFPASIKSIGNDAFYGLYNFSVPNAEGTISDWCNIEFGNQYSNPVYYARSLYLDYAIQTDLVLPANLSEIKPFAFYGCSNLSSITCQSTTPPITDEATTFSHYNADLYVPNTSVTAYKNDNTWKKFNMKTEAVASYTITVISSNNTMGSVTGSGAYDYNATATLTATPNTGYKFVQWNDGNTQNPRSITVIEDATYTATFATNTYDIAVNTNNSNYGTVSGVGTYNYNATATLTATPNTGYKFVQWNDGNTQNPRSITVTDNATYTATFAINTYNIAVNTNNRNYGTVSGAGVYNYNVSVTLTATPKTGYKFTQWNDGNTQNPRTITVTEDATYTATFAINTYNIAVNTNNSNYGTVSGAGVYNYNVSVTLTATPKTGYKFTQWNDGNTQNPRTITVTEDATYTATFAINTYNIAVNTNNSNYGTVSGASTYNHNATATLTATPNTGYKFVQWNDGNTQNPRTITVTESATYTATFAINTYNIAVNTNNSNYGTVSGAGTYNHNATATLTATANTGYKFVQWNDGNTQNPRSITVTESATYTATFAINTYTITVNSSNNTMGSVSGSGTYNYNATATLTATPNSGYTFTQWNDGNTQNPRTITVTEDATYIANFAVTYNVDIKPSNNTQGNVTGSGDFTQGAVVTITATPNTGYKFVSWNDGSTENPRTITVNGDISYVATFADENATTYVSNITSNDEGKGSVSGSGVYVDGQQITIVATPEAGYKFVSWNDGSTENPRTVTVDENISYEATFAEENAATYVLTVTSANANMGSAIGSGTYVANQSITIYAIANNGYKFVQWNDGNTQNPRQITVTQNATYTATFEANTTTVSYTIVALSSNNTMGSVSGGGTFDENTTITLTATPNNGYKFVNWSDGSTENPRSITVTGNATYTANFAVAGGATSTYTISVLSSNNTMGSVNGGGSFDENTTITISATPNQGYKFVSWNDGNTQNPRQVTVTENATYIANFSSINDDETLYTVSATSSNEDMGIVTGSGQYAANASVTLYARPFAGYKFIAWSDGNTQNPRTITVTANVNLIAIFIEESDAIAEANSNNAQIFGGEKRIVINNAANANVAIYDVVGRTVVKEQRINTNNEVFTVPQTGIYIVRMGKAAKKVFVK